MGQVIQSFEMNSSTKLAGQKFWLSLWMVPKAGIVSEGVAQVFDDVCNPHSHCGV